MKTVKFKTAELTGDALRWAVAMAEWTRSNGAARGIPFETVFNDSFRPDTSREQGGLIIEREDISVLRTDVADEPGTLGWAAESGCNRSTHPEGWQVAGILYEFYLSALTYGPTPLIAGLRCYAKKALGPEVEVPEQYIT